MDFFPLKMMRNLISAQKVVLLSRWQLNFVIKTALLEKNAYFYEAAAIIAGLLFDLLISKILFQCTILIFEF